MTPNGNDLKKYLTKCRVCGHEFASSPFEIPIVGQPTQKIVNFVSALMKHLGKHNEQMGAFAAALQEFSGLLCLSHFEIEDPQLIALTETIRARVHRFSRKSAISDAMIADRVSRLAIPADQVEPLEALLRDMRDILSEEGRYAPKAAEPSKLVTV